MNWNRAGIKEEAKVFLRKHYWKAFVVCLIVILVTGGTSGAGGQAGGSTNVDYNMYDGLTYQSGILQASIMVLMVVFLVVLALFFTVIPLLNVGKCRFFIKGLRNDEDVRINHIISTFTWGEAWPVIKTSVIRNIQVFLWSLLFIIPGIIKSYEYYFTDYIMAENPTMSHREILDISKKMTYGSKLDIFVLELSFIGWDILGLLACGVGTFFVKPYKEATYAVLYETLSQGYRISPEGDSMSDNGYYEENNQVSMFDEEDK